MAEKVKRIVTIHSGDNRYIKSPFPSVPTWRDDLNTFLTGQHIDPNDPQTENNLTVEQMRKEIPLRPDQKEKFKFIINPDIQLRIRHGLKLDVSINEDGSPFNDKDYWTYQYILNQTIVAKSKKEFDKVIHRFFIEDKESEAKDKLSKRDKIYKAVALIRDNLSLEKLVNISILLNYFVKQFNVDPNKISKTQLEDLIYDACEKYPDEVLKCFDGDWKENLYILTLAFKGIITRKGDDFYDNGIYLGKGLDGVKAYMSKSENRANVNKWSSLYEGNTNVQLKVNDNTKALQVLTDGLFALAQGDTSGVNYAKEKLEEIGNLECLKKLLDAEKSTIASDDDTDKKKVSSLRMQCGRLKLPKSDWENLNSVSELEKYISEQKLLNQ